MQHQVERRKKADEYLNSERYEAHVEAHVERVEELWGEELAEKVLYRSFKPRVTTRIRRGKVVEIPEVWQGMVTHPQTIRKRKSKQGGKRTKMKKDH